MVDENNAFLNLVCIEGSHKDLQSKRNVFQLFYTPCFRALVSASISSFNVKRDWEGGVSMTYIPKCSCRVGGLRDLRRLVARADKQTAFANGKPRREAQFGWCLMLSITWTMGRYGCGKLSRDEMGLLLMTGNHCHEVQPSVGKSIENGCLGLLSGMPSARRNRLFCCSR